MADARIIDTFFEQISKLPNWQQDILVRIIKFGKQTVIEKQLDEIILVVKKVYGIPLPENSPEPILQPLTRDMLPEDLDPSDDVTIYGISNIKNVNALAEAGLVFRKDSVPGAGLTVVYGRNGSGKTGIIRILKAISAARQKEKEAIYTNCLTNDQTMPTATVHIGDNEYIWRQDISSNNYARKIRVFDNKNANIYLLGETAGKTEILYIPDIFMLLDDLVQIVRMLQDKLQTEKTDLVNKKQAIDQKFLDQGIKNLRISKDTKDDEIAHLIAWDDNKNERWGKIKKVIDERTSFLNNKRSIKLLVERKTDDFRTLEDLLSIENIQELFKQINEQDAYKAALEQLQRLTENNNPLPNVCSDAWETLWKAAESFIGQSFDEHSKICPLCMQTITGETGARIAKFHAWVSDDTKQKLNKINTFLGAKRDIFKKAEYLCDLSQDEIKLLQTEPTVYAKIRTFLCNAKSNLFKLREKIKDKVFVVSDYLNVNISGTISDITTELDAAIKQLEQPISSKEQEEYDILKLNLVCHSNPESVQNLKKYDVISNNLGNVLGDCNTSGISLLKTNLNKLFLVDNFNEFVKSEKDLLGLPYDISFNISSSLGKSMQELACDSANIPPSKFMSEGEAKIAALSCFIAEYKMSGARIPLVFDDPITSLDHEYQEQVVNRIVDLAKETQIIVFTHHILFAKELRAAKPDCDFIRLKTENRISGIVNDGCWDDKSVSEKIAYIEEQLQIVKDHDNLAIRDLGGLIREIWEQSIEDILFNGTITRFEKSIHTQNLKKVRIDDDIYPLINAGMTKTSEWANHSIPSACDSKVTKDMVQKELENVKAFTKIVRSKWKCEKNKKERII